LKNNNRGKIILSLSIPLALLVIFSSLVGLLVPDMYSKETQNWIIQSTGQDAIDLILITPVLLITSILAFRKSKAGFLLWGGTVFYLIYTFVIYCFSLHFNNLFVVYCITLGLSFYSFIYFLYLNLTEPIDAWFNDRIPRKTTGVYFIIIAFLFYFIWLSSIIPAQLASDIPKELADTGLYTNPVHVLDLSVLLPGSFLIGLFLLKKKNMGYPFAIVMLVFFILMDITIGTLVFLMNRKGLDSDLNLLIIFSVLTLFSIYLLTGFLKNIEKNN